MSTWRAHAQNAASYMGVGAVMTGINAGLLFLLVSGIGLHPVAANIARYPLTAQLHFYLHKHITWRNQRDNSWRQWRRYHVIKLGDAALGQVGFALLIAFTNVPYLAAYFACLISLGVGTYMLNGMVAFAKKAK